MPEARLPALALRRDAGLLEGALGVGDLEEGEPLEEAGAIEVTGGAAAGPAGALQEALNACALGKTVMSPPLPFVQMP